MPESPWATFFGVWALTTLSRLSPGTLTVAAAHIGWAVGVRRAAAFLVGAWVAEAGVLTALLAATDTVVPQNLQPAGMLATASPLALAAAGLLLLWPNTPARLGHSVGIGSAVAAGCAGALLAPGVWSWWGVFGVVLATSVAGRLGVLATGLAVAVGLATSHLLVLAGLRAPAWRRLAPGQEARRYLGLALLAAAGLVLVCS